MFRRKIFFKTFTLFYLFLLILYGILKHGFEVSFVIYAPFRGVTSLLSIHFYQYFALMALGFSVSSTLFFKVYLRQKAIVRTFIFFPLIGLLTSLIGGFLCGVLFAIHDMFIGFYPGLPRFKNNMLNRGMETSVFGFFMAIGNLTIFTSLIIIYTLGLLEFLRNKFLLNNPNKKQ